MLDITELNTKSHHETQLFMDDVDRGLSHPNKYLLSKYFYDKNGSEIFNLITKQDFYYLTRTEINILDNYKEIIADQMPKSQPFNLIELGPGEGIKTQILIETFLHRGFNFTYIPIDISYKYLHELSAQYRKCPMAVKPIIGDYSSGLQWHKKRNHAQNLLLFLGSSIGNFNTESTLQFLRNLNSSLNSKDLVVIGFDLIKDKNILLRAYDDDLGLTKSFNLNLLSRINHELGANFDLTNFTHYANYNETYQAMESYLISTTKQSVEIKKLNKTYHFSSDETIHMEYSFKYSLEKIADFAKLTNFKILKNLCDNNNYFVNSMWQVP